MRKFRNDSIETTQDIYNETKGGVLSSPCQKIDRETCQVTRIGVTETETLPTPTLRL